MSARASGSATVRIPEHLSFEVMGRDAGGGATGVVVRVSANVEWALRVEAGGLEWVTRGVPGSEHVREVPAELVDGGALSLTLERR